FLIERVLKARDFGDLQRWNLIGRCRAAYVAEFEVAGSEVVNGLVGGLQPVFDMLDMVPPRKGFTVVWDVLVLRIGHVTSPMVRCRSSRAGEGGHRPLVLADPIRVRGHSRTARWNHPPSSGLGFRPPVYRAGRHRLWPPSGPASSAPSCGRGRTGRSPPGPRRPAPR